MNKKMILRENGILTPETKEDERMRYFPDNYDLIAHYVPEYYVEQNLQKIFIEDCTLSNINGSQVSIIQKDPIKKALKLSNSKIIQQANNKKIIFTDRYGENVFEEKICRFCGKRSPEVSFHKKAHAISELLGNKVVFIRNECDNCNELFGKYEDSLGKYLGPYRTISQIIGKGGIPTHKEDGLRIDVNNAGAVIQEKVESGKTKIDKNGKRFIFCLERQPYIPIDVFKTFVIMALSLVPEKEFKKFNSIKELILDETDKNIGSINYYANSVIFRFIEGRKPLHLQAWIFRRKKDSFLNGKIYDVPYCQLIVEFGNYSFQIIVPNKEEDIKLWNRKIKIPFFISTFDYYGKKYKDKNRSVAILDLRGTEKLAADKCNIEMHYEERIEIDGDIETIRHIAEQEGINLLSLGNSIS